LTIEITLLGDSKIILTALTVSPFTLLCDAITTSAHLLLKNNPEKTKNLREQLRGLPMPDVLLL